MSDTLNIYCDESCHLQRDINGGLNNPWKSRLGHFAENTANWRISCLFKSFRKKSRLKPRHLTRFRPISQPNFAVQVSSC